MNTRKNNNSIIFFTTLGVYLGLVLVGATPQVLAQAAMTRQFDVRDEIEVKDDFDENPDLSPCSELESDANLALLPQSLSNVSLRTILGVVDVATYDFGESKGEFNSFYAHLSNVPGKNSFDEMFGNFISADWSYSVDNDKLASKWQVEFVSAGKARHVASALDASLRFWQCDSQSDFTKIETHFYRETTISTENNQVFIVTHLPRAGLDSLLAKDAK